VMVVVMLFTNYSWGWRKRLDLLLEDADANDADVSLRPVLLRGCVRPTLVVKDESSNLLVGNTESVKLDATEAVDDVTVSVFSGGLAIQNVKAVNGADSKNALPLIVFDFDGILRAMFGFDEDFILEKVFLTRISIDQYIYLVGHMIYLSLVRVKDLAPRTGDFSLIII